ncbi:GH3 auxin-responsive promoter family protein [Actinomadura sp. NEAU-AAG7]|uniref:GH3 family domain-containing protein n=1 Tax=Actinomadura sp. NEAU-AAG7 TaxID=2839640 RepID=UPI001BE415CE|nr:GH3 auxin-responsive promoter family protein [Actinomadura sp. NEAU-AAG7]MBT2210111.1 GH3 auxin-responsive promoter family protein [Actinomadura sp. NEAU-AAG7]
MSTDRGRAATTDAYRRRVRQEYRTLRESLADPRAAQERVLEEILTANSATAFGREHGLTPDTGADGYRKAVPIRGHEGFEPWLERVNAGEGQVLTAEEPIAFFSSSGTTGAEKMIPVTTGFLRRSFLPFYFAGFSRLVDLHPGLLDRDDAILNLWQDPHSKTGRAGGGRPHLGPSQLDYGKVGEELAVGLGNRAPWSELPAEFDDSGPWERTYLRLRIAAEHDVLGVIAVNPAIAAALPRQLRHWGARMVAEIRDGTLGGSPFREPNPARADELERAARRGGGLRPVDLWPRLELLLTWNTYLSRLYLPGLLDDYGPKVRVLPAPIGSSEGPLAVPVDDRPAGGPLVVTSCFYEFVPAEEEIDPRGPTLSAHELEEGREYHVILSHLGGLYRCAVRDIVKVTGFVEATPVVEYACRKGLLSVAGERLRESQMLRALAAAAEATGLGVRNVLCRADAEQPRHEVAVAFREPPAGPGAAAFGAALDRALRAESPAYAAARDAEALAPPLVRAVDPEGFWREWRRRVQAGERPPRVKDRVFQDDPEVWARVTAAPGTQDEGSTTRD